MKTCNDLCLWLGFFVLMTLGADFRMLNVFELDFDYQENPVLNQISFHLPKGGLLHLKGVNGAGKTTLLKLIAGLYSPTSGHIQFFEKSIHDDLAQYQRQLCFIGHQSALSPLLSIRENCHFDLQNHNKTKELNTIAPIFKLDTHFDKLCSSLSAGQRRQVALLRLWMTDAILWLLDEPFVALDDFASAVLMEKIQHHRSQGGSVILTSHQSLFLDVVEYQEFVL